MFVVLSDQTIALRFNVGKKYVMLSVNLKKGEDIEKIVKEILEMEQIPVYLELSILSSIHSLLKEELRETFEDQSHFREFSPFQLIVQFTIENSWKREQTC